MIDYFLFMFAFIYQFFVVYMIILGVCVFLAGLAMSLVLMSVTISVNKLCEQIKPE